MLVPNTWTQAVIEHQLTHRPKLQSQPWPIDGYPRRVRTARHLLESLSRARVPVWAVVHLRVSEPEATRRLLARGRLDDTAGTIAERFRFFRENVMPTLEYLEGALGRGRVLHVDAEGSSEAVYARVNSRLSRL
ncbi:MAG: nucleoside monophosphate kinase [Meiothermus sp.]|nr:nucleoside monophosphate kinase [Meiothermus sp.]